MRGYCRYRKLKVQRPNGSTAAIQWCAIITSNIFCNKVKLAKIIPISNQLDFITHVLLKRHGVRNVVIALLSFKAGLRACEIAGLDWSMVCGPTNAVKDTIDVSGKITKGGARRQIPCHPDLQGALCLLHAKAGYPNSGPVCLSERGRAMTASSRQLVLSGLS